MTFSRFSHPSSPEPPSPQDAPGPEDVVHHSNGHLAEVIPLRPEAPKPRLEAAEAGPQRLVYHPRLVRRGTYRHVLLGQRSVPGLVPWGFWGGVVMAVVALLLVVARGTTGLYSMWDVLWALLAIGVGALMFRLGARTTLREELMCELDTSEGLVQWPTTASGQVSVVLPMEDITEVVFGMVRYPVSLDRPDVNVHAFTLLVRDREERLLPVIEASIHKAETFAIGQFLAQAINVPLTQVGMGVR